MGYNKSLLLLSFLCLSSTVFAQLSTNEQPVSFDLKTDGLASTVPTVVMPELDMAKIEAEDLEDEKYDMPPRFGYPHKVNLDLTNSGIWQDLPDGGRLWRLNVACPKASSINFLYDKFWIPEGGKFFIYTTDRGQHIGAFTSQNNKGDRSQLRGFATQPLFGSEVTLEYYEPGNVVEEAIISINYIVHGYRYYGVGRFGTAGECHVNINCSEGQPWQNEKSAVALILVQGSRICTGSLMNTTSQQQQPYFLTADHCLKNVLINNHADTVTYDAISNPNLDGTTLYWNYETAGCDTGNNEPIPYTTSGATVIANNSISDFALLQLSEDPKNINGYNPYYLGWDCSGSSGDPGVCIHHPNGDVKKISSVLSQPISTNQYELTENSNGTYWKENWKETYNNRHGGIEGGSSGAPLLAASHKSIGQLRGGYLGCINNTAPAWSGKFSVSWTGNGNSSIYRRLNHWLDSQNTSPQTMEGLRIVSTTTTISTAVQHYGNIRVTSSGQLTIQANMQMMENSKLTVESGGKLIINGATLSNAEIELKPGSTLRIINNGIIDPRTNFYAPVGAIVDIQYGQIL